MTTYDNTPTVVVVIAPTITRGVLTVRRALKGEGYGQFALPGGYQERPESLEQAGAREFLEETGIQIDPELLMLVKLVTVPDGSVNLAFYEYAAAINVAAAKVNSEVLEFSDTPCPTNLAFPLHTEALREYFERTT